jgi:hypothetical protein
MRAQEVPEIDADSPEHAFLIHLVKTVQYRMSGVLEGVPEGFPSFELGAGARTPVQILSHVCDVLGAATARLEPGWVGPKGVGEEWLDQVARYRAILSEIARVLASVYIARETALRVVQGPLSDVLAHVGQLAMLRRVAGAPLPGQNFFSAELPEIRVGDPS